MSAIHYLVLNVSRISSFLRAIVGCLTAFARALFLPRTLAHVVWRKMGEVPANMLAILEAKFDYLFKLVSSMGLGSPFSDKCWRNGQALSLSPHRSTSEY